MTCVRSCTGDWLADAGLHLVAGRPTQLCSFVSFRFVSFRWGGSYSAVVEHAGKPLLVLLTKQDLVPSTVVEEWVTWIGVHFPLATVVDVVPPRPGHAIVGGELRPSQRRRLLKRHIARDRDAEKLFSCLVVQQCAKVCVSACLLYTSPSPRDRG